jgi:hypothetical protein
MLELLDQGKQVELQWFAGTKRNKWASPEQHKKCSLQTFEE